MYIQRARRDEFTLKGQLAECINPLAHWSATVMTPLGKINKLRNDLGHLKANETFI